MDTGDCGRAIGVQEFGAVADDAAPLLVAARQKAGDIDKCEQWDIEGVAQADEACCLSEA